MKSELHMIGRTQELFNSDVRALESTLQRMIGSSNFLIIGAAGTIGQAVTIEIAKREPKSLHLVDLNENLLVELVRELRSRKSASDLDLSTYSIDINSPEFEKLFSEIGQIDYVLNLSALKHVRSEQDEYTLMRMVYTNIFGSTKVAELSKRYGVKKYFCVSTDKATNPVNMMGASKRIMELFLHKESHELPISMARFANVAFSNGSLLDGFEQRVKKYQPISAPNNIRRYFITQKEAGELCMLSCLLGGTREVFFPKHGNELQLTLFTQIARNYIKSKGFEVLECASEQEARVACSNIDKHKRWPCYFFESDTTGEKDFEEFYGIDEDVDFDRFSNIGVIKNNVNVNKEVLMKFEDNVRQMYVEKKWSRADLINQFKSVLENFDHKETGKFLNQRM